MLLLKIIALAVVMFIINRVVLKLILKEISDDKIVKVSIILTGIIIILFILLTSSKVEGFEDVETTNGGDISRNLEEAPNAETLAQDEAITEDVKDNLQDLLNQLQEKEEETNASLDITEPRPSTNSSMVITEGISGQRSAIEETKKMADQQISLQKTAEPEPVSLRQEPRPTQDTDTADLDKIRNKYTILPIDQWMKPDAIDIINATSCSCPTISPWGENAMAYN